MRNAFAEIIVDLTESVEPNLVPEMIEMFKGLIKDVEGEVRIQAAKQIHTFCKALPADSRKNYTMQHIIPLLKDLAMGKRLTFESVKRSTFSGGVIRYTEGVSIRYTEGASIRYRALRMFRKRGGYKVQLNFSAIFGCV